MNERKVPFLDINQGNIVAYPAIVYRGKNVDGQYINYISFHRFPGNKENRVWLQRARLIRRYSAHRKHSYLCYTNFVNGGGPAVDGHSMPLIFADKVPKTSVRSNMIFWRFLLLQYKCQHCFPFRPLFHYKYFIKILFSIGRGLQRNIFEPNEKSNIYIYIR